MKIVSAKHHERDRYAVPTLDWLMGEHGNDWSHENKIFRDITGRNLDDLEPLTDHTLHDLLGGWDIGRKISIVIPSQLPRKSVHLAYTLHALKYQSFFALHPRRSILEIIIVNDGPATPDQVFEIAEHKHDLAQLRVICLRDRLGPARTRNVGLTYARGDIVFFLDSDMLLAPRVIAEHIIRHEYIPNLALLSFRSDISLASARRVLARASKTNELELPLEWNKDWKARLHTIGQASTLNGKRLTPGRRIRIYDLTKGLTQWDGVIHCQRTHANRNLPSAFGASCVSVRREHLIAVGGFRGHYHGWGIEDRDLGSRLLARGLRLVTVRSAGARHVKHAESPPEQKEGDRQANLARYTSLIHEPYRERPENLTRQLAELRRDQWIYPPLEFTHGVALPRTHTTSGQSPLVQALETLLHFTDSHFRRTLASLGPASDAGSPVAGDLKWRVMIEEAPGGTLKGVAGINTSHRPDASMRIRHGTAWVGFVVKNAIDNLAHGDPSLDSAARPMAVNLESGRTADGDLARFGLSQADLARTSYYRFIIAAPIVIDLGWPGRSHYCMGAVTVHAGILPKAIVKLAKADESVIDSIRKGRKGRVRTSANECSTSRLLRGSVGDLAQSCGNLIVKHWIQEQDEK